MELRPYQLEALDAIVAAEQRGVRRQLLSLPTGAGKTVIFGSLPQHRPQSMPMLVLAHRDLLLDQAADKMRAINPDLHISFEQGVNYADLHADVVIASVATLGRTGSDRLHRFERDLFGAVVVDEAHHAAAATYRTILDHFDQTLRIGVTATPRRSDNLGLNEVFDEIVYAKTTQELIEAGYLSDIVGYRFKTDVDLSDVRIVRGNYHEAELSAVVNTEARNEAVVDAIRKHGQDRHVLVFCVDIAHAQAVAAHCTRSGYPAEAVWGTDPDRNEKFRGLEESRFKVLTNCQLATEGVDIPIIDMVVMARPTRASVFYAQAIGRGLRLYPDKPNCIVADIVDVSKGARPIGVPSLFGLPSDFDLEGESVTEATQTFKKLADTSPSLALEVSSLSEISGAWERINIFTPPPPNPALLEYSQLVWMELGEDNYILNFEQGESLIIRPDELDRWHVYNKDALSEVRMADVDSMLEAFRFADSWAKEHRSEKIPFLKATSGWRSDPPSPKQIKVLKSNRIPWEHLNKGQASMILDQIFANSPKKSRPAWVDRKIEQQRMAKRKF